jgi:putative transcriptional regulator
MLGDRERRMSGPPADAGRIIREWRGRIGLTQERLAHALEVTFSTVSRWENGHVRPSKLAWKALERLAAERGSLLPLEDGGAALHPPSRSPAS